MAKGISKKQTKHIEREYTKRRNRYKRFMYVMGGNCTLQPKSNGHPQLRPKDIQLILSSKNIWSCMFFMFYRDEQGENAYHVEYKVTENAMTLNEMHVYIMDVVRDMINLFKDQPIELIGSGYFVAPDKNIDLTRNEESVIEEFINLGCYDEAVTNLTNEIKSDHRKELGVTDGREFMKLASKEKIKVEINPTGT